MKRIHPYLGAIDQLVSESGSGKDAYIHPALKNTGCVTLVVLREAIAPVVFRNAEQEITDIEFGPETYVRAVPNKFKYVERGRGLQVLRAYGVGGRMPQNKTVLHKSQKPSDAYDLNTLVFGDSAVHDTRILPVRSAVNYSDGVSLLPKFQCVDETFHNRAMEDGSLFDAESKKNSDNLFTRHFILPGTLMVQVLSTRGKVLPAEGFDHLLLSMGLAGAYGGQTSVTGVNLRTRMVGLYGSRFERPLASPYEILSHLNEKTVVDRKNPDAVAKAIHDLMAKDHEESIPGAEVAEYQEGLIRDFEEDAAALKQRYADAAPKVAALFDSWFGTGK
jgi:CRISPR type I-D-associated protein Csc2